jgi:hypothetical protein
MVITGGGISYEAGTPVNAFNDSQSYPSELDGTPDTAGTASAWTARGFNARPIPHTIQAYAVCVNP